MFMKVIVLHKTNSEVDTRVQGYLKEFQNRTGKTLEVVDPDSRAGVEIARLHDILQFPAILVTEEGGEFVQAWTEFEKWPTISELSYYAK